jgi:hypothetical protein
MGGGPSVVDDPPAPATGMAPGSPAAPAAPPLAVGALPAVVGPATLPLSELPQPTLASIRA